jgi:hypothetical protein
MNSPLLDLFHQRLEWPSPADIEAPTGSGAKIYARLAKRKVEQPLRLRLGPNAPNVYALTKNPKADDSEEPVGLFSVSPIAMPSQLVHELHRLAWNFCQCPLLVVAEPHLVRVWSCYETPSFDETEEPTPIDEFELDSSNGIDRLTDILHWIDLASGQYVANNGSRFQESNRADKTLHTQPQLSPQKLAPA